ncbi:MAG: hypothetical protein V3T22_04365 [Planctomycetota bacterium]
MTQRLRGALPLTLALLVGLGAGAVWRARGAGVEHEHDEHADHAQDPGRTGTVSDMDMDMDSMDMPAGAVSYAIDLANDTCPVMGNQTEGEVYTHWKGLRVQFCCAVCEEEFLEDPEGMLRDADVDPTAALEAIAKLRAAEGEERAELLTELSSRFHVVEVEAEGKAR